MRLSLLNTAILALGLAACGGSDNAPAPGTDSSSEPDGGTGGGTNSPATAGRDAGHSSASSSTNGSSTSGSSTSGSSGSTNGNGTSVTVSTVAKDGGHTTVVSASTTDGGVDPSLDLGDIGDIFGEGDGGSKPVSNSDGGTPDSCENAICFDVFDCAVWHLDSLDCGFTACENFVCVK